ncbi:MAG: DUF3846 domain-containing protein [Clostridia bacterium]|nr:DUF3846 domain-containing protein [Clostridia bacterium]MBQ5716185.1 DUF3846 domain-containing protein [Clostridia bacterium]
MGNVIKIMANGTVEKTDCENITLDYLQSEVDGYIETLRIKDAPGRCLIMIIDEEGKLKNKPVNELAGDIAYIRFDDYIVGDVVIVKEQDDDFVPLTDDEANKFMNWLCEWI